MQAELKIRDKSNASDVLEILLEQETICRMLADGLVRIQWQS